MVLESDADAARLRFLMAHDSDPFVRWKSGQSYALQLMLRLIEQRRARPRAHARRGARRSVRRDPRRRRLEPAFVAQALSLPSEGYVGQQMAEIDVDSVHAVREFLRTALGERLPGPLREAYRTLDRQALQLRGDAGRAPRAAQPGAGLSGGGRRRGGRAPAWPSTPPPPT